MQIVYNKESLTDKIRAYKSSGNKFSFKLLIFNPGCLWWEDLALCGGEIN